MDSAWSDWSKPIDALWALYRRPGGMTSQQLFGLIERVALETQIDQKTRQLMQEGLRATRGDGLYWRPAKFSPQRETLRAIQAEDFGPPAFPDLRDRVTLVEGWQAVRTFLGLVDGAVALDGRIGRRYRKKGLVPPEEKVEVLLGGSTALMMAKWLTRRVPYVTHVGPLSAAFDPYQAVMAAMIKDFDGARWGERDDLHFATGWESRIEYYHGFDYLSVGVVAPLDALASLFFTTEQQDLTDIAWTAHTPDLGLLRTAIGEIAQRDMPDAVRAEAISRWCRYSGDTALPE